MQGGKRKNPHLLRRQREPAFLAGFRTIQSAPRTWWPPSLAFSPSTRSAGEQNEGVVMPGRVTRAPHLQHVLQEPHHLRTSEAAEAIIVHRISDEEMPGARNNDRAREEASAF